MIGALAPLHGTLAGSARRRLVSRGRIDAPLSLSRAQVSSLSTAPGVDGVTWNVFAANQPRFSGTARRLLLGGQRTNQCSNPRLGSTGGAAGNNLVGPNSNEIARMIADVQISKHSRDTSTSDSNMGSFSAGTMVGQPLDTPCIQTVYVYLPGSVNYGGSASLALAIDTGSVTGFASVNANFALRDQWQRIEARFLARTADINPGFLLRGANFANGAFFYSTMPQREYAPFASTPILPPLGSPQASTRGADLVTAPLSGLGIGSGGVSTVLMAAMVPSLSSQAQVLFSMDDATLANRYSVHLAGASGNEVLCGRAVGGGALTVGGAAGQITAGSVFRLGATIDNAGRIAVSVNGGAVQGVTGGPTSGLVTFRPFNNAAGTGPLFGEVLVLDTLPFAVPGTALPGLVAALPV